MYSSDGPANVDGSGTSSSISTGMYGKWSGATSSTLPSSSGSGASLATSSSSATMAVVGSMTLGGSSGSQLKSGVTNIYDKEGHLIGGGGMTNRQVCMLVYR